MECCCCLFVCLFVCLFARLFLSLISLLVAAIAYFTLSSFFFLINRYFFSSKGLDLLSHIPSVTASDGLYRPQRPELSSHRVTSHGPSSPHRCPLCRSARPGHARVTSRASFVNLFFFFFVHGELTSKKVLYLLTFFFSSFFFFFLTHTALCEKRTALRFCDLATTGLRRCILSPKRER